MKGKIEATVLKAFSYIFVKLGITDIRVEVRDDGWYAAAVDSANVMIAEVLLAKNGWESYDFKPKVFALDIDKLYHYTQDFRKGEVIEVSFEDTRELECCFYLNGTLTRTFTLLSEEDIRAKPKIPELEYKIELTLLAPQIEVIKDVLATKLEGDWGTEIGIGVVERAPEEYELCLYSSDDGGIKSKRCVTLERGTNYLVIEPCASVYSISLFKSIFALLTKEVVATGTVTMQFGFEYPLKIRYERKGLEVKQILLAPRIGEGVKESDVFEELRTPFKPIEEEEEKEVEIESTATTLCFLPTAKGRLLKPFKRTEYSDDKLIDILLEQPLPELEGILSSLKLEAIWKETSYGRYSGIVKEEEISRESANIDAIIKIVENYDLMKYPYLEIREYYKHPEQLEKGKIELKDRVDALTRYFFGGFGNYLTILSANLSILKEPAFSKADKEEAKKNISRSFAWIMRKYAQIPFSELSKSPFYDDFKPLFEIKELLLTLEKEFAYTTLDFDKLIGLLVKIAELGKEYAKTVGEHYKELTGKSLGKEDIETRALLEYQSKEQIQDHARWLQEQDIKPNSFEKAAMEYYGVEITEEEPPWRRLMDVLKDLEKEHGLEVPEDIAIATATEVGIEKPEDLIGELKRDGLLYSPAKGLIARVEKPPEKEVEEVWQMTKEEYLLSTHAIVMDMEPREARKYHREQVEKAFREGKPVPEEVLKDYPDLIEIEKPRANEEIQEFFRKDEFKVKHYVGYRTEAAYGEGERDLRSVVKHEIEELENKDIIDWTGVSDYIALVDSLYTSGYTEVVWLCKEKKYLIDYYCDGDPTCPIKKYEITDGLILSDLGDEGQLIAYQPEKVKIEEEKEKKETAEVVEAPKEPEKRRESDIEEAMEFGDLPEDSETKGIGKKKGIRYRRDKVTALDDKGLQYVYSVQIDSEGNKKVKKLGMTDWQRKELQRQRLEKIPSDVREIVDYYWPDTNLTQKQILGAAIANMEFDKSSLSVVLGNYTIKKKFLELFPNVDSFDAAVSALQELRSIGIKEEEKEKEEVPETPQETIARVMKFKSYTGSRPDWQFLLNKAVNDVDMLKADRYDLMRATGKLLGYSLTPEPSNVGLDRWLAQQLANETGQSVLMIGGSVTVEPEEFEPKLIVHYPKVKEYMPKYASYGDFSIDVRIRKEPKMERYSGYIKVYSKEGLPLTFMGSTTMGYLPTRTKEVINDEIMKFIEGENRLSGINPEQTEVKEQWMMTKDEFIRYHKTDTLPDDAYEEKTVNDFEWLGQKEKHPKLIRTYKAKNGENIELRQTTEKLGYTKLDEEGEIVREKGLAVYLTDEEIQEKKLPVYDTTVVAFNEKGQPIGYASNEFGADGVWIAKEYQKQGIGVELLIELRKQFGPMRRIGQMTHMGEKMALAYHRRQIEEALKEGKPVPEEVLQDYPEFKKEEAKEPWEMTYREFFDIAGSEYGAGERFGVPTKNRMPINPDTGYPIKGATPEERIRRAVIMKALKEGKTIPEEVLKDYPELKVPVEEYKEEEINEWQNIPELDAEIRTIKKPTKDFDRWTVEIGIFESLGEQGGDILTEYLDEKPTLQEIKNIVIQRLKDAKAEMNYPLVAKSGREEMQEEVIDRLLKTYLPPVPPEEEIPEKWENVTKEKLEETRRTSKSSEKYAVSQAKAAKKVSDTEETVYEKLPDELDLGPYSEVLLYSPVEEIRYLSKAERAAFIKLVDRGWFQVYRVSKPVSDKYPSGFTYVLKKTREEEKPPEKEILFPPPYELIKKERLSQEEIEQLKADISEVKKARELWREKLPGYEAKQAIAELDRNIADYEAKLKEFEEKLLPKIPEEEVIEEKEPWQMTKEEYFAYESPINPRDAKVDIGGIGGSLEVMPQMVYEYGGYLLAEATQHLAMGKFRMLFVWDKHRGRWSYVTSRDTARKFSEKEREKIIREEKDALATSKNLDIFHKNMVKYALEEGKPVPEEVLADYPELVEKEEALKPEKEEEIREYGKWIRENSQTLDYKEVRDKLREWIIEYYKLDKDTDYIFKRSEYEQIEIGINDLAGRFFDTAANGWDLLETFEEWEVQETREEFERRLHEKEEEAKAEIEERIKTIKPLISEAEAKVEEKVKVHVLEDIPTFMGTDGEIYKLKKGDIVELPKTNADVLCKRGVVEPFVEIRPPEKVPEKVRIHGILKTRYRCPICYRAAPDNFCMVHSDVEAIDLLAADEPVKDAVIDLTFLDLFKTKYPEKKRWTIDELHDAMGIDIDYAPEFLGKQRPPESYAEYYEHEFNVKIEGVKKIVPPEKFEEVAEERREIEKRIEEHEKIRDIKETIDLFIYRHKEMLHLDEFLAHAEDVLVLITELPDTERGYYRKKMSDMITLATPKKQVIKPEEVDLIKKEYSKFLAEGKFPMGGFLDYVLSHRGERMSTAVVDILETFEEVGYGKDKIEIIRKWFT